MRALILGGCGFIGSHVVDALLPRASFVRVLDRTPERYRPPCPGVEYVHAQISDRMALIEALSGIDTVFHLVSTTFPGTADHDPVADVQGNLISTLGLLQAMQSVGVRRLMFLSSGGTVYGKPDAVPVCESHPLRPIASYGIVKTAIEHYIAMWERMGAIDAVVLRASNPFGARQGHLGVQGIITTFLHRLRDGLPIEIWGDGSVVRDYLYVSDLAELCVRATESGETGVINAGSGRGHSILEIVDAIQSVTGRRIQPVHRPGRAVDVPVSILDVSLAKSRFGWQARTSLEDGLRDTWEWVCRPS
jgi:UDP-glucose 4-epimerase